MSEIPFALRPAKESDLGYVKNSWVKSFGTCWPVKELDQDIYRTGHSRLVEVLARRANILVAADEADEDTIFGWCATEGKHVIHYVYVRAPMRGNGIATALLRPYMDRYAVCSHPIGRHIVPVSWVFNPYALWADVTATEKAA